METKADLRNKITSLESEKSNLIKEISEMKAQFAKDILSLKEDMQKQFEEIQYANFVSQNGKFLSRFIKEYITDNLSVESDNDEGYLETKLILGENTISYSSASTYYPNY